MSPEQPEPKLESGNYRRKAQMDPNEISQSEAESMEQEVDQNIRPFPYKVSIDQRLKDREVRRLREKISTEFNSNPDGCVYAIKKLFALKAGETSKALDILDWIRERVEQHQRAMKRAAEGMMENDSKQQQ